MRFLLVVLFTFFSITAQANQLKTKTFESQFDDKQVLIKPETQWLIFSYSKDGGTWVKESFNALNMKDADNKNWVYVADISAMPSLITRFFALPKMRDYAFSIGLDKEGDATKDWPRQEEAVTVMKLEQAKVTDTQYFKDRASLEAFLKTTQQ